MIEMEEYGGDSTETAGAENQGDELRPPGVDEQTAPLIFEATITTLRGRYVRAGGGNSRF